MLNVLCWRVGSVWTMESFRGHAHTTIIEACVPAFEASKKLTPSLESENFIRIAALVCAWMHQLRAVASARCII